LYGGERKDSNEERNSERKERLMELDGIKEDEVHTEWKILRNLQRDHNKGTEWKEWRMKRGDWGWGGERETSWLFLERKAKTRELTRAGFYPGHLQGILQGLSTVEGAP
jgi:hypothetical protein